MKDLITICITNCNSSYFVQTTLYCLQKLTKNKYKIIIRDNNSKIKDYLNLKKKIKKYSNVELYRIDDINEIASMAHGIALNDLIQRIDTQYGVILDSDFTFLHKDWDQILIDNIDNEYPIIGTQHTRKLHRIEGYEGGADFPLMVGILFDNEIFKTLKIDFRPIGTPADGPDFKDVGAQLEEKYLKNGYKGKLILFKNTRTYKKGPFQKVIGVGEYYLEGYEEIFGSHFGRGSTLVKVKNINGRKINYYKIPIIGDYFQKSRGKRERKKWIKISKNIVDQYE